MSKELVNCPNCAFAKAFVTHKGDIYCPSCRQHNPVEAEPSLFANAVEASRAVKQQREEAELEPVEISTPQKPGFWDGLRRLFGGR